MTGRVRRSPIAPRCDGIDDAIDVMIALGDCGDMVPLDDGPVDVRPDDPTASAPPFAA